MVSVGQESLLSANEAAIKLGITKELLFAYIRYAPKKYLGHDRKLPYQHQGDQKGFRIKDLEDWDQYLWETWAKNNQERPKIPTYIIDYLKIECGGRCALCGEGHPLDNAHIEPYEISLSHHHHNLIRLCKDCHTKFDEGIIPKQKIQNLKIDLVEKLSNELRKSTEFFTRSAAYQPPQPTPLFVGRKEIIETLRTKLLSERFVLIEGVGGIGKTQLLLQALQSLDNIQTLWLDVESYKTLADLELALINALSQVGIAIGAGATIWHSLKGYPIRIVLDGIEGLVSKQPDSITDFLINLIELTQQPKLVVTTQVALSLVEITAYCFAVSPLSLEESRQLIKIALQLDSKFASIIKNDSEWLIQFCDGHPLTLKLVIGLLRHYKKANVVVEKLHKKGTELLKDPVRSDQKRSTSLKLCLELAYETFNHPQRRLLQYLSNFPDGCMVLQAEQWHELDDFEDILADLRRFFFVETRLDGLEMERLHLLHPISEFVRAEWLQNAYNEAAEIQMEVAQSLMIQVMYLHFGNCSGIQRVAP